MALAIDATDWTVDRATGNVRYTGDDHGDASPTYASVIQFHRWLQDLADDASSAGDDEMDITDENPSARSTDNIIKLLGDYNIDDNAAEHLCDGSVIQGTGGTEVIYDGIVNFGNADVQIQILQDGAILSDDWWNYGGAGLNADAAQGISHRFMVKVRTAGADIDGRRLIGTSRTFLKTYSEFGINGTARGNNVLALSDASDLNNTTEAATVATWTTITNVTEGFAQIDVDNNGSTEDYYSEWNKDSYSINQFFERMKWLTRDGSASTIYGLNGELFRGITHGIALSGGAGTWVEPESLSWGSGGTAGTGQLLAVDDVTGSSSTKMWIQLLTGVAPSANTITGNGGATATAGTVTDRSALLSTPFVGASTGSALIGSYGLTLEATDLSAADKVFDLTNTQISPPNYVTFTVGGLITGEDRVLVGPWDGTTTDNEGNPEIDYNQNYLATALTADDITSVVVSGTISSDTPADGYIRVQDDDGFYRRLHYTSWISSTYTVDTEDGQEDFAGVNAAIGKNVWISYIDELAKEMTLTTALTGPTETSATVNAIPAGTPASGTIKIERDNGTVLDVTYSSHAGSTFTITSTDFSTINASIGRSVWESTATNTTSESFTTVYSTDRDLVVKVRDGGSSPIKEFITSAANGSNGGSSTAIRTSDS